MSIIQKNNPSLLIFIITFFVFSSFTVYYVSQFNDSLNTNPKTNFIYLFSGDEPVYLSITSNIIYNNSIFVEDHFLGQFNEPKTDPLMDWPEQFEEPRTWHSAQRDDGHYISKHGYGLSYMLIPGYYLGSFYGVFTTINVILSLTSVVIYNFISKLTSKKIGFITAIVFSFSTIMINTTGKVLPDVVMMFFIIFILYTIFYKSNSIKYAALAGSLLGFVVFF